MLTEGDLVRRIEIGIDSRRRRRERRALHVLLERIDGVRAMDDRVFCVEAMSGTIDEALGGVEPVRR